MQLHTSLSAKISKYDTENDLAEFNVNDVFITKITVTAFHFLCQIRNAD